MTTLDTQWLDAKREYDRAKAQHGPRSIRARMAWERMHNLNKRILRRDNRKRAA